MAEKKEVVLHLTTDTYEKAKALSDNNAEDFLERQLEFDVNELPEREKIDNKFPDWLEWSYNSEDGVLHIDLHDSTLTIYKENYLILPSGEEQMKAIKFKGDGHND